MWALTHLLYPSAGEFYSSVVWYGEVDILVLIEVDLGIRVDMPYLVDQ